jgi:2-isopropylmalate synthase
VATITGIQVPRNKAIVGRNAFAHESGIHQDGMLKERSTYEIIRPEDVGLDRTPIWSSASTGGRAALADRAKALGYQLSPKQDVREPGTSANIRSSVCVVVCRC